MLLSSLLHLAFQIHISQTPSGQVGPPGARDGQCQGAAPRKHSKRVGWACQSKHTLCIVIVMAISRIARQMLPLRHAKHVQVSGIGSSTRCRGGRLRTCRIRCCQIASQSRIFRVVALDVEYIHFRCSNQLIILPGEVCVVDTRGNVLLHSYCNPGEPKQRLIALKGVRMAWSSLLMVKSFHLQAEQKQQRSTGPGECSLTSGSMRPASRPWLQRWLPQSRVSCWWGMA